MWVFQICRCKWFWVEFEIRHHIHHLPKKLPTSVDEQCNHCKHACIIHCVATIIFYCSALVSPWETICHGFPQVMMTPPNGAYSAILTLGAANSPVTGESPSQRPVTRNFDVFFDLRLNKRLSKQSWGWWFETPSCPLCRHCNVCY